MNREEVREAIAETVSVLLTRYEQADAVLSKLDDLGLTLCTEQTGWAVMHEDAIEFSWRSYALAKNALPIRGYVPLASQEDQ